jgi:hypothetical protein
MNIHCRNCRLLIILVFGGVAACGFYVLVMLNPNRKYIRLPVSISTETHFWTGSDSIAELSISNSGRRLMKTRSFPEGQSGSAFEIPSSDSPSRFPNSWNPAPNGDYLLWADLEVGKPRWVFFNVHSRTLTMFPLKSPIEHAIPEVIWETDRKGWAEINVIGSDSIIRSYSYPPSQICHQYTIHDIPPQSQPVGFLGGGEILFHVMRSGRWAGDFVLVSPQSSTKKRKTLTFPLPEGYSVSLRTLSPDGNYLVFALDRNTESRFGLPHLTVHQLLLFDIRDPSLPGVTLFQNNAYNSVGQFITSLRWRPDSTCVSFEFNKQIYVCPIQTRASNR